MRKHTKIYLEALGLHPTDFVCSELSGEKANDIHHIESRKAGGNPAGDKDRIENLQALTRSEHIKYGDKSKYMTFLFKKHYNFLDANGVIFDRKYLQQKIEQYSLCESN